MAIVLLAALYLAGANLFLSTSLFARIVDANPEDVDIHYARAWSIYPGRVHAENLSIRGSDSRIEWVLGIDEADFSVALLKLPRKRFECTSVRARGIRFAIRQKRSTIPSPEEIAALPPIPGFGPYALKPIGPPAPTDWPDSAYPLWSARLEHVTAEDVSEIWIDTVRFEGSADIDGRFSFKPLRGLEVGPGKLRVAHGAMYDGPATLADAMDATELAFTLERVDLRTAGLGDFLHRAIVDGELHARVPDLGELPLPSSAGVTFGGVVLADGALHLHSGVLAAGSAAELTSPSVTIASGPYRLSHALAVSARVTPRTDGIEALSVEARLANVVVTAGAAKRALFEAPEVVARGDATDLDLGGTGPAPFDDFHGAVEVARGDLDAGAASGSLLAAMNAGITGRVTVQARIDGWPGERRASTTATLHTDLRARAGETHLAADIQASVEARDISFVRRELALDSAHVEITSLALAERGRPAASVARIVLDATSPHVALSDPLRELVARAHVVGARIIESRALDALLPEKPFQIHADGASFAGDLDARFENHVASGRVSFNAKRAGIAREKLHVLGDLALFADVAGWNLQTNRLSVNDARVTITGAVGGFAPHRAHDFSFARVTLEGRASRIDLERPRLSALDLHLEVDGAELADVREISRLSSFGERFPVESGTLKAAADLTIRGTQRVAWGSLRASVTHAQARLRGKCVDASLSLVGRFRTASFERGVLDLTGTRIEVRDLVASGSEGRGRASGDIGVDGTLRLDARPTLDARLTLDAQNAGALLGVLEPRGFVKLFVHLDDLGPLSASARMRVAEHEVAVVDLDARGTGFSARGSYAKRGERQVGGFAVKRGIVSAGLGIDDGGTYLKLFNLDSWLAERRREVEHLLVGEPPRRPARR